MDLDILQTIQQGQIFTMGQPLTVQDLPWHDHPAFPGVALRHLITGMQTDGKFSSHLVRVKSGCEIGNHIHEGKWELHEVVCGQGTCRIESAEIPYSKGVTAVIPADLPHSVQAAETDLYLLAKFIPALL
ncbi:MAG: cupin domain-containing protein [Veillonellaceae bacterium]|nr:cupin domain-containing protein [Veillonellaceae bacterium]